jgi:hypothetical protein
LRERKRERERERESEKELRMRACFMLARVCTLSSLVRERQTERERERCRMCPELLFLFLKGMMGALAPFNYLVLHIL